MKDKTLTYGQLEYLLTELGYHFSHKVDQGRIWVNPEYDALKFLPDMSSEEPVRIHHLMTVHKIVIEKGIVEEDKFQELLNRAAQYGVEPISNVA